MIELYDTSNDEDLQKFIIKTDVAEEDQFVTAFSDMLVNVFADYVKKNREDPEIGILNVDLPFLLKNFVEICCKFRGYKADVIQQTITISKGLIPNSDPVYRMHMGRFTGTSFAE